MANQVTFSSDAISSLQAGVHKIFDAVRVTMGPKGRNVVIAKKYGGPQVTNDGVTIVKEIELQEQLENLGAQMIKEAATKTQDECGDGTTTAICLAAGIVNEGIKMIAAGANPMGVKKGIERAVDAVVVNLEKMTKQVTTKEEIAQAATITSKDVDIGELIAEAMDKSKKSGVIKVEEGQTMGLGIKMVEGMQFDNGYISPYMVTDPGRMEAVMEDAQILLTDKKISSIQDILPLIEALAGAGKKNLVIIAEDIEGEALTTLVLNKLRGTFSTLAIKAPAFGDRRKAMLQDIAILTGGRVITEELGLKLENATLEDLGEARKVISDKDNTTLVEGKGKKADINARVSEIKVEIENTSSDYDKEKLQERLAKLAGGVAIIKVGAATEIELKEKKHRMEDALAATRAAVEEGIIPGGGTALLRSAAGLTSLAEKAETNDEKVGIKLVQKALEYPLRQIAENCGLEGSVIVQKVLESKNANDGFNATDEKVEDLVKVGIIDPKKVARAAMQNAGSVASIFLTTEATITEIPEEDKPDPAAAAAAMGGGMGGMGMPGMM